MSYTAKQAKEWFDKGKTVNAHHLLIVEQNVDGKIEPVYVMSYDSLTRRKQICEGSGQILAHYELTRPFPKQAK